jgi:hypothetical protein
MQTRSMTRAAAAAAAAAAPAPVAASAAAAAAPAVIISPAPVAEQWDRVYARHDDKGQWQIADRRRERQWPLVLNGLKLEARAAAAAAAAAAPAPVAASAAAAAAPAVIISPAPVASSVADIESSRFAYHAPPGFAVEVARARMALWGDDPDKMQEALKYPISSYLYGSLVTEAFRSLATRCIVRMGLTPTVPMIVAMIEASTVRARDQASIDAIPAMLSMMRIEGWTEEQKARGLPYCIAALDRRLMASDLDARLRPFFEALRESIARYVPVAMLAYAAAVDPQPQPPTRGTSVLTLRDVLGPQ